MLLAGETKSLIESGKTLATGPAVDELTFTSGGWWRQRRNSTLGNGVTKIQIRDPGKGTKIATSERRVNLILTRIQLKENSITAVKGGTRDGSGTVFNFCSQSRHRVPAAC
jgi:hypothetical protein